MIRNFIHNFALVGTILFLLLGIVLGIEFVVEHTREASPAIKVLLLVVGVSALVAALKTGIEYYINADT